MAWQRHYFALGTANKEAAAAKAAEIWRDLTAHGLEVTLAKHKSAAADAQTTIAATTIGEWIAAASEVWDGKPATFGGYARALRFIASEILALSKSRKRFGRTQARAYREQVDGVPWRCFRRKRSRHGEYGISAAPVTTRPGNAPRESHATRR